eukprot:256449-Amphidinium_carterae.3
MADQENIGFVHVHGPTRKRKGQAKNGPKGDANGWGKEGVLITKSKKKDESKKAKGDSAKGGETNDALDSAHGLKHQPLHSLLQQMVTEDRESGQTSDYFVRIEMYETKMVPLDARACNGVSEGSKEETIYIAQ